MVLLTNRGHKLDTSTSPQTQSRTMRGPGGRERSLEEDLVAEKERLVVEVTRVSTLDQAVRSTVDSKVVNLT